MFKFTYNNEVYQVKFQHIQRELWKKTQAQKPKVERRPLPPCVKGKKAVTVCTISKVTPEGPVTVVKSQASCFDNDLFIKKLGRTIALGRAIKGFGFDAEIREAYNQALQQAYITSRINLQKKNQ